MTYTTEQGCAYTLASGRLFVPFADFHEFCERLLDRPILTHEFGEGIIEQCRKVWEARAYNAVMATVNGEAVET